MYVVYIVPGENQALRYADALRSLVQVYVISRKSFVIGARIRRGTQRQQAQLKHQLVITGVQLQAEREILR